MSPLGASLRDDAERTTASSRLVSTSIRPTRGVWRMAEGFTSAVPADVCGRYRPPEPWHPAWQACAAPSIEIKSPVEPNASKRCCRLVRPMCFAGVCGWPRPRHRVLTTPGAPYASTPAPSAARTRPPRGRPGPSPNLLACQSPFQRCYRTVLVVHVPTEAVHARAPPAGLRARRRPGRPGIQGGRVDGHGVDLYRFHFHCLVSFVAETANPVSRNRSPQVLCLRNFELRKTARPFRMRAVVRSNLPVMRTRQILSKIIFYFPIGYSIPIPSYYIIIFSL